MHPVTCRLGKPRIRKSSSFRVGEAIVIVPLPYLGGSCGIVQGLLVSQTRCSHLHPKSFINCLQHFAASSSSTSSVTLWNRSTGMQLSGTLSSICSLHYWHTDSNRAGRSNAPGRNSPWQKKLTVHVCLDRPRPFPPFFQVGWEAGHLNGLIVLQKPQPSSSWKQGCLITRVVCGGLLSKWWYMGLHGSHPKSQGSSWLAVIYI